MKGFIKLLRIRYSIGSHQNTYTGKVSRFCFWNLLLFLSLSLLPLSHSPTSLGLLFSSCSLFVIIPAKWTSSMSQFQIQCKEKWTDPIWVKTLHRVHSIMAKSQNNAPSLRVTSHEKGTLTEEKEFWNDLGRYTSLYPSIR